MKEIVRIEITHARGNDSLILTMDADNFRIQPTWLGKKREFKITFVGIGEVSSVGIQFSEHVASYLIPALEVIYEGLALQNNTNLKPTHKL